MIFLEQFLIVLVKKVLLLELSDLSGYNIETM